MVNRKELTVTGITADNKIYDGNTTATLTTSGYVLNGILALAQDPDGIPDVVTLDASAYTANFDTENVGQNKPVTVTGLTLGGASAPNYVLTQPTDLMADILDNPVTVTATHTGRRTFDQRRVHLYFDVPGQHRNQC